MNEIDVLYEIKDRVAFLTINREQHRNSISPQAIELYFKYLDRAENDSGVRVVCITGAGDKAFCSGADLSSAMTEGGGQDAFKRYADLLKRIAGFSKPTVAKINGYCLAGGTGFMLACDIVIAKEEARFGTPEVNVGLFPLMIGALIFRNVLRKTAMEMILLGEKLTARKALEMGMVTRVVPSEQLDSEVQSILDNLVEKSPIGMKIGKEAFYEVADMPFAEALDTLSARLKDVA
ncbi:MAG: enoyl-CoA hydratase/isomerase family protein, partial [bacterium]